jgi:hypothetical protein
MIVDFSISQSRNKNLRNARKVCEVRILKKIKKKNKL